MRRLSLLLVSSAVLSVAAAGGARAQALPPSEVTAMLAKSHTLDAKCNILASDDRQELMDFLARAEILLAERQSVKAAQTAIRKGKAEAQAAACGPEQDTLVRSVLAAARASTTAESDAMPQVEAAAPAEPPPASAAATAAAAPPLKPTIVAEDSASPALKKKPPAPKTAEMKKKDKPAAKAEVAKAAPAKKPAASGSLTRYASLAKRYYVELKCRNMSDAAVQRLYSSVLATHRKAVAESGASAVRSVLRTAEARANAASCG